MYGYELDIFVGAVFSEVLIEMPGSKNWETIRDLRAIIYQPLLYKKYPNTEIERFIRPREGNSNEAQNVRAANSNDEKNVLAAYNNYLRLQEAYSALFSNAHRVYSKFETTIGKRQDLQSSQPLLFWSKRNIDVEAISKSIKHAERQEAEEAITAYENFNYNGIKKAESDLIDTYNAYAAQRNQGGSRKRSAHSKRKTHRRKTHRRKTHRR